METLTCTKCYEEYTLENRPKGMMRWKTICEKCYREISKSRAKKVRRDKNPKLLEKENLSNEGKKKCTKCNTIKELKDFYPFKQGFLGLRSDCIECYISYDKKFQQKTNFRSNRDKTSISQEYRKNYRKQNIEKFREYERNYRLERRKKDVHFKIKSNLMSRISTLVKDKVLSSNLLLGCSKDEFIKHIESQFVGGMNWDNYGKRDLGKSWQIDHIIPCSSFDLTKEEEQKKCFHYTNLQPLWWVDNLKKSNNINNL